MTEQGQYVIRGGADGRERLRILSHVMKSAMEELFARIGVGQGWSCLDVGCGGGDVTLYLASLIGPTGQAVGIDLDPAVVAIAQREAAERQVTNVSFHACNANDFCPDRPFDLVYSRFLLTHLSEPARLLDRMVQWLRPGGLLILEDIDFTGHFCYPESTAFRQYVDLYSRVVYKRGGDPNIGPRLPILLLDAHCVDVQMHVEQPAALSGEAKFLDPLTCEYIADTLVAEDLSTREQVNAIAGQMYDFARNPRTVVSMPRIIQAWGHRALTGEQATQVETMQE